MEHYKIKIIREERRGRHGDLLREGVYENVREQTGFVWPVAGCYEHGNETLC